jgi:hypothetical protein
MARQLLLEDGKPVGIICHTANGSIAVIFPAISASKVYTYRIASLKRYGRYELVDDDGSYDAIGA